MGNTPSFLSLPSLSRSRTELWGWDIPGLTTSLVAAVICWAIRSWLQRCVCGRNSGRDGDRGTGREVTVRERVSAQAGGRNGFIQTHGAQTSPEKPPRHLNSSLDQRGGVAPLAPVACAALLVWKLSFPPSTNGCFHVPLVASRVQPVSNGGPRTDLPSAECVLVLVRPTTRSICPPAREVRTAAGESERGESRAGWLAGWERGLGRLRCAPGRLGFSGNNKKKKKDDAKRSRAHHGATLIIS